MKEELKWNSRGLLDPVSAPLAMKRAPYAITLEELVERFGTTQVRCGILKGFLEYRQALHALGLVQGFQWIDGSFIEEIEILEERDPKDIDVVTFYNLPDGETQQTLFDKNPVLFPSTDAEKEKLKELFPVDGSMSCLDAKQRPLVKQVVFWYSLWSHRRDQTWKGFVQIELDPKNDAKALTRLIELEQEYMEVPNED